MQKRSEEKRLDTAILAKTWSFFLEYKGWENIKKENNLGYSVEGETIVFVFFFFSNWVNNGKREGEEFDGEVSKITFLSRHGRDSERGQLWPWYIWNCEETPRVGNLRLEGYRIKPGRWRGKYTKDQLQGWLRTRRVGFSDSPSCQNEKTYLGAVRKLSDHLFCSDRAIELFSLKCSSCWGPLVLWIQYCTPIGIATVVGLELGVQVSYNVKLRETLLPDDKRGTAVLTFLE